MKLKKSREKEGDIFKPFLIQLNCGGNLTIYLTFYSTQKKAMAKTEK